MGLFDFLYKKQNNKEHDIDEEYKKAVIEISNIKDESIEEFTPDGEFGYDINNPVMVRNIVEKRFYLNNLECENNNPITYFKLGNTVSSELDHPITVYEIINEKADKIVGKLYIYEYGNETSKKTPKKLKFKKNLF
ncbi:hypothetical protein LJB96_05555 [Methanobrevibacter sp. OttesenSCG-928-K11]|nr:hypothetical protein [Methanobrevibacter sp. OttesenSCG-928-K11]